MIELFTTPSFPDIFNSMLDNANYLWVFLLMMIESSFIPFPSEIVVPPAAYVAMQPDSGLTVPGVCLAATAGALAGSIINYALAVWIGRPIVYAFADSRVGHLCMLSGDKVKRAEDYFDLHGAVSTFIGRLIPVIRQLISIPAGLARMNFGKFAIYTTAGAAVWNAVLCLIGYLLAKAGPDRSRLYEMVERYNRQISLVGYAIGAVCVAYIVWHLFIKPAKRND